MFVFAQVLMCLNLMLGYFISSSGIKQGGQF